MRFCRYMQGMSYVDKLVVLKYLALSLSNTSPEILIDKNKFLPDLSYTYLFGVLNNIFLTAVRPEVNNLESCVVVQEL